MGQMANSIAWPRRPGPHTLPRHPVSHPKDGRIAVKIINHFGDEVMKVSRV